MTVRRLAPVDAQTLWMSAAVPNDQFLLYGFGGAMADPAGALDEIRRRACECADLSVRVRDTGAWRYPVWDRCAVDAAQFVTHPDGTWAGCLAAAARLVANQLDPWTHPWRLHVFPTVDGVPGVGAGCVVLLQISHALADGGRSSALAARLFGRPGAVPAVPAPAARGFVRRSFAAAQAHRRLVRDSDAGLVPPQADSRPALRSNTQSAGALSLRTLIRRRDQLPGTTTVTVGVLTAVSAALAGHLRDLGDDPALLGAEVPMAKPGVRRANNHYGNVGVGLYPHLPSDRRVQAIAADLLGRRRRASHPALAAEASAFAAIPAPLLRWGVGQFDPDRRSDTVVGNTVVSSVHRGAADLSFGGAPVVLTAGFPSLSPMMGVTHGVHGIGDTVAVSVHAAQSAIGDVDAYLDRLDHALG
ncbi:WS/DGAT domain-containing protein [Mycolicibacterium psychrotolerans]|uniref:O-acyltransferase WSD1 C-terminal domain-containing protein n=1 Tax=Mycolicibacterium psychrotolerans TaxID=216929 RepID=A0A7I7MAI8_9MYCO|nr:WS/DGAT domain-containing protein [Mycolicibacterium psychrotolerans]BBX68792.1 hypothetical protein MPSYJ_22530 [Mycolicibacterium psychrotolerans]